MYVFDFFYEKNAINKIILTSASTVYFFNPDSAQL